MKFMAKESFMHAPFFYSVEVLWNKLVDWVLDMIPKEAPLFQKSKAKSVLAGRFIFIPDFLQSN